VYVRTKELTFLRAAGYCLALCAVAPDRHTTEDAMFLQARSYVLCLAVWCIPAAAAAQDAVVSGVVTTRNDGLAVPGATVSIRSLNLSTTTTQDGRYTLSVPAARVRGQSVELQVSFSGTRTKVETVVLTAGPVTHNVELELSFHEEVSVGSRSPGAAAEKAVPVDIITAEQIESTGAVETMQVIQALAPSFNFPRPTISDGTDSVRPATLRGLGPDQVLVLINGKRRHQTALIHINSTIGRGSTGVDLNAIPVAAIQRIEILRDGAAAQYGSDAIAGVINIVLKSGVSPTTLSFRAGGNTGSFQDVFDTTHDFSDGGTYDLSGSSGFALGKGAVTVAGEYRNRHGTNRAGPDTGDAFGPQPNIHWGDSEEQDGLLFANAEVPLAGSRTSSFYAFGGWSRRTGSHGGNYRRRIDAGNWPSIYPNGFLPLIEPTNVDASVAAGIRGVRAEWFWDVSGVYGHNRLDYDVANSLNASLGPAIPPNQTEFYSGAIAYNQITFNGDAARAVDVGLASPAHLAFGVEYRRENYQIFAGEPNSYLNGGSANQFGAPGIPGAQVFPGFRPTDEVDVWRNAVGGYVDIEADVATGVQLGLAGRYEHFDDFGSTADGKVTVRLEPDKRFVIRGAASTGFRAPSLGQIHFSTVSTNFSLIGGQFVPVEAGTYPVASPQARALGATDLTPEESLHYSGGVVLNPIEPLEVTVDVYRVAIDDRIVLSDNFTGEQIAALLQPFGANGARYFTNAIDTRTKGVDLLANYRLELDAAGTLRLQVAFNHTDTSITRISPTPPQLAGFDNTLFSRVPPNDIEFRRFTCAQPENNTRLTADWRRQAVGALLRVARYGDYCSLEAIDQIYSAEWVIDVEATYRLGRSLLGFGVQNLGNALPDRNLESVSNRGGRTFPRNAPFGFNGRYFYGRIAYTF
jgi:iron complex outermembrane recepter protein